MATIRNYRKERFTTIDNAPLNDPNLSWRAKGILTYLIGKPADWTVRIADLVNRSKEGRDAVRTAIQELKDSGYCVTVQKRDAAGVIVDNETIVSDNPGDLLEYLDKLKPKSTEQLEIRLSGNPTSGKSDATNERELQKRNLTKVDRAILAVAPGIDLEKRSLFKNSEISTPELLRQFFPGDEYADVDFEAYFETVAGWNENKRVTRNAAGWISTVRKWIARDRKSNTVLKTAAGKRGDNVEMANFFTLGS